MFTISDKINQNLTGRQMSIYLNCPRPVLPKSFLVPPNNCSKMPFLISLFSYMDGAERNIKNIQNKKSFILNNLSFSDESNTD